MKNKFEKDFYESRDAWWSIQYQIENDADQNTVQELKHIMELSLYNQRDMLLEIDKLKAEIAKQNEPKTKRTFEETKKREIRFSDNPLLEKIDYFLYRLKN